MAAWGTFALDVRELSGAREEGPVVGAGGDELAGGAQGEESGGEVQAARVARGQEGQAGAETCQGCGPRDRMQARLAFGRESVEAEDLEGARAAVLGSELAEEGQALDEDAIPLETQRDEVV